MKENVVQDILNFMKFSERLKFELRHSWLSSGRQESVAEHSWHIAMLSLLVCRYLDCPVNLEKVLKMSIIHDLVEAEAGDVPAFETGNRMKNKFLLEQKAIENIRNMFFEESIGCELYDLWCEFEKGETNEAKFVKALDNLEVQIQHNLASFSTWEEVEYELVYNKMDKHCCYDSFLQMLCDSVKLQAEKKMQAGGVDVNAVKERIASE